MALVGVPITWCVSANNEDDLAGGELVHAILMPDYAYNEYVHVGARLGKIHSLQSGIHRLRGLEMREFLFFFECD